MRKIVMATCALALGLAAFGAIVPEANYTTFDRAPLSDYRTEVRSTMSLDGEWELARQKEIPIKFKNDRDEPRTRYDYQPFDPATAPWKKIMLPQKMDPFGNIAHFRRTFELTSEQAAKAVVFKTEMIGGGYWLVVNGKEVARVPQPMGFEARHDLTDFVKAGTNEIWFKIQKGNSTRVWEDKLDGRVEEECLAYPMFLEFSDKVSIDDAWIITKVEPEKIWTAKVTVTNRTDKAVAVVLSGSVESEKLKVESGAVEIPAKGSKEIVLETKWPDAKLWTPATPELYYATFQLSTLNSQLPHRDSFRQRFGFREITCVGTQIRLNGKPFMMRRQTYGSGGVSTLDDLKRLRKNGYVGLRLFFPNKTERICRLADEYGFLITTCASVGCVSCVRSDIFWKIYEDVLAESVTRLRNHPSIICWGVSNEFGYVYGGDIHNKSGRGEAAIRKQQKAAKVVADMDPTRPWTACGEAELGWPYGARGPMPIISMHYPFSVGADWARYPSVGYWYADGGGGWQGMTRREKPACISEDLYHGLMDAHTPIAKIGGDEIWTVDGYAKAYHEMVRCFTEGHYTAGLAGWEPWCVYPTDPDNKMFELGPLHPDYLIALRGFEPNLFAGEPVTRKMTVFNQWFTPVKGKVVQENVLDGKVVSSSEDDVTIDAGGRFEKEITIPAPDVDAPTALEVRFKLIGAAGSRTSQSPQLLTERTYRYNIFPKVAELEIPKGTALLAVTNSPLCRFTFPKGVYTRASDAVKSGATRLVVDAPLSYVDGAQLNTFVENGGFILFARDDWSDTWRPGTTDALGSSVNSSAARKGG